VSATAKGLTRASLLTLAGVEILGPSTNRDQATHNGAVRDRRVESE
jgi:hypothetical protein